MRLFALCLIVLSLLLAATQSAHAGQSFCIMCKAPTNTVRPSSPPPPPLPASPPPPHFSGSILRILPYAPPLTTQPNKTVTFRLP